MKSTSRYNLIGVGILVAAALVTYMPVLNNGYVWDDDLWLTDNQAVHSPGDLGAIWQLDYDRQSHQLKSQTTQYYPLVFSSFWLENRIWGLEPAGYHAVNVLLHILNALVVWAIARRLGIPGAWMIGAIFALHPVHVESVAWITQRRNVLSGLFYLLAMWSFLNFDESRRRRDYITGFGLFLCALLSKTVAATLPVVLLLILFYRHSRNPESSRLGLRSLLPLLPLLLVGVMAGLVTANLEQGEAGARVLDLDTSFVERLFILVPSTFSFYAGKILWPLPVTFIYPRWQIDAGHMVSFLPLLGLVATLAGAAWTWRRHGNSGPMLLLMFAGVTLAPALGLFKVYFFRYSWVADHWQYLGSLGFIILLVAGAAKLGNRYLSPARLRNVGVAISVLVLVGLAATSHQQTYAYEDAETLWRDTIDKNPAAWIALNNLGRIEAGQAISSRSAHQRLNLLRAARDHFEQAMEFPAARPEACNNLANIAYLEQDYGRAARMYARAIRLQPDDPGTYSNLRKALSASGQVSQATAFFRQALDDGMLQEPLTRAEVLHQLACTQADQGLFDQSAASVNKALETYPALPNIRVFYANVLVRLDRYREAITQLRTVSRSSNEYISARVTLARLLATCPDPTLRNPQSARALVAELRRLFGGRNLPAAVRDVMVEVESIGSG